MTRVNCLDKEWNCLPRLGQFWRADGVGKNTQGGFQNIPLHLQMEDFIFQSLVFRFQLGHASQVFGRALRRGSFLIPIPQVG